MVNLFNVYITHFSLLLKLTWKFIKIGSLYMSFASKQLNHEVDGSKEISTSALRWEGTSGNTAWSFLSNLHLAYQQDTASVCPAKTCKNCVFGAEMSLRPLMTVCWVPRQDGSPGEIQFAAFPHPARYPQQFIAGVQPMSSIWFFSLCCQTGCT